MTHLQAVLEDYPVTVALVVQWGEMDAYQHVNNTVYFRYFETARMAYFAATGVLNTAPRIGPILASTGCRFKAPLSYPDALRVGAKVTHLGDDRMRMAYAVASGATGRVVAEGEGLVVGYDYEGMRKHTLPQSWREGIARIEGQVPPPMPNP